MKNQVGALKVKIKSLAAEARIIRLEETRALDRKTPDLDLYRSLRSHRVWDVRREQRSSLLAYAILRGTAYTQVERPDKNNPPDTARIRSLVEKFGGLPGRPYKFTTGEVAAWLAVRC